MLQSVQNVLSRLRRSGALHWVAAAVAAGVLLGVLGPFGSYLNSGWMKRVGYWIGAMLAALVLYALALRLARMIAPAGTPWRWPVLTVAVLTASVLNALGTHAVAYALWPVLNTVDLPFVEWYLQTATLGGMGWRSPCAPATGA